MPNRVPSSQAGFTMVELLVVLFLFGLAASAVVLTVSGASRSAASQAEQFAARVAALRDRSVVESRPLAFWVRASGYGFEKRSGQKWQPIADKPFATTDWRAPLTANVEAGKMLRVAFDQNGLPSAPMDITLSGGGPATRIKLDENGSVDVSRP